MNETAMAQAWSAIHVGDGRVFLYGPRFGRAYLHPRAEANEPGFLRLIGLGSAEFQDSLFDPAEKIEKTLQNGNTNKPIVAPLRYVIGYRLLHYSRHFIPLRMAAKLMRKQAIVRRRQARSTGARIAIADMLHAVERAIGAGDCYPRALLTAYLAAKSGQTCTLAVGALAPTRKMHVWCVVDQAIPYEPSPEHYLYQPLWTLKLTP